MNKGKKLLVLLMAAMMALSATACSGGDTAPESSAAPAPASSQAATEAAGSEAAAEEAPAAEGGYDEHLVLTHAVSTTILDVNDDEFGQFMSEKFNFEWEIVPTTQNNVSEMMRIWASSGDLPDLTSTHLYYHPEVKSWAEQGLIKQFPDGWRDQWPNVSKAMTDSGVDTYLNGQFGGDFVLLKPIFSANKPVEHLINHWGVWYRADWVEAVGMEAKDRMKASELMEAMRLIKEQDPGQVGSALVPMSVPTQLLPLIFVAPNSLYSNEWAQFYQDDTGAFQWGPASPDTLEGLKLWRQAYDEGLLHQEFYTLPTGRENEADMNTAGIAALNVAAGMGTVGARQASLLRANQNVEPEEALQFAYIQNEDGKTNTTEIVNFYGVAVFNPELEDNKFTRLMDIIDFIATPDGQNLVRMGFEGVDWEKDASGNISTLLGEDIQVFQKYQSLQPLYTGLMILPDDFGLVNPTIPEFWRNKSRDQYVNKTSETDADHFAPLDLDVYFYDSPARTATVMDLTQEYASIVLAGPDVETNFNNWVAEKMPIVQPLLDELTALKQ